jgi:RimJ/RimL family protein N-acetyltransferase
MELLTARLRLRELEEGDAPACNAYESDPEVVRWQSHDVRTLAESLAYIRQVRAETADSPRHLFDLAITLRSTGELIGRCGFVVEERQASLWYILHRAHWGRGYVPEAARAVLDFAFSKLRLHRVTIDTDPRNAASIRVAEKLGMRKEAHHRQNAWIKGEWTDSLIFALLASEWRPPT